MVYYRRWLTLFVLIASWVLEVHAQEQDGSQTVWTSEFVERVKQGEITNASITSDGEDWFIIYGKLKQDGNANHIRVPASVVERYVDLLESRSIPYQYEKKGGNKVTLVVAIVFSLVAACLLLYMLTTIVIPSVWYAIVDFVKHWKIRRIKFESVDKSSDLYKSAIHEAAHAFVACCLGRIEHIRHVTILPTSREGLIGHLIYSNKFNHSQATLQTEYDNICINLAAKIALEMEYGVLEADLGFRSDLGEATQQAHNTVTLWGQTTDRKSLSAYRQYNTQKVSDKILMAIDNEVTKIVNTQAERARRILEKHKDTFERLVEELLIHKKLHNKQLRQIVAVMLP